MRKFEIIANKKELRGIGISYDITGLEGTFVCEYVDTWYALSVTHKIGDMEFTNEFDLPQKYLKEIK